MARTDVAGGRFDFDDGGTYCGGWEDGKAHGHGVCTGPKSQGEYSGSWHFGFEVSGVYTWPSGSTYEGQWQNGKRHGLGVESRGRWTYRGEWTQGFKGRYGIRQSVSSGAKYEGTWANGLQDGYGSETYADGGTFQGQWMRGMRHGYGVRSSATFGLASHYRPAKGGTSSSTRGSLSSIPASESADPASDRDRKIDDFRGGFVLKSRSDEPPTRRRSLVEKSSSFKKTILQGLKIKKQRSTGDIDRRGVSSMRSSGSNLSSASSESSHSGMTRGTTQDSLHTNDSNISFVSQDELCDGAVVETYMGEWKNDRRCGFGVAERSDGLKYEGEWYNNKKYGYGVTTMKDGTREEGKYKNNVLVSSGKKKHLFVLRSAKFKDRVEAAVQASQRGAQIALQKADIAISRTANARGKAEQADIAAQNSREDSNTARVIAKQFDPDIKLPGEDMMRKFTDKMSPDSRRPPLANISNQSLMPQSPPSIRTDTSRLDPSKLGMMPRGSMQVGTAAMQERFLPQQQQQQSYQTPPPRTAVTQDRYDSQPQINFPAKPQYQQDGRYSNQMDMRRQQYPPQTVVSLSQDSYVNTQPSMTVQRPDRYAQQQQQQQQDPRYQQSGHLQSSPQNPYVVPPNQSYGYQQQLQQPSQYPPQKITSNYLDPSRRPSAMPDQPPVPNRQGSFRRSIRDPGGLSMQQSMSDHFDHYRQEPRPRTVIKHGRRIPSPPRAGMPMATTGGGVFGGSHHYPPSSRSSYGPDATPDSGVSESMDGEDLSPSRFVTQVRKGGGRLPPMIYADSHASSLLSFAPSDEGSRTVSPTISSIGLDSELVSEVSIGSSAFQRTASLYINPPSRKKVASPAPEADSVFKRKKSLPHGPGGGPPQAKVIPREEVAVLSSQRREEVRRMQYESERLRSNPLLYLVKPDLKDWFSRQQLIMLVLFINISLAILFFKLLS